MLIEGSNDNVVLKLKELSGTISHNVYVVDEEQRQWVHVAAVFANNFTNHLFSISESIMMNHGLSFDILKPLILSFVQNLQTHLPSKIQTGPAARGDKKTIEQHLQLLADETRLKEIYKILTNSIISSISQNHK